MSADVTRAWLNEQVAEYERLRPAYQDLADVVERELRGAVERLAPLAIVQVRVKSVASFAEKCLRKRARHPVPAHQLTDLCGARVIVQTLDELAAVGAAVQSLFEVDWENSVDVASRLEPSQFGYRSVHYVASLHHDVPVPVGQPVALEVAGFGCAACGVHHRLKAEIQLRTTVQHAWADFAHDLTYKDAVPIPEHVEREVAVIAAELEEVDREFERLRAEMRAYATAAGRYLTEAQLRDERALVDAVRNACPDDLALANRSAELSARLEDWQGVVDEFEPLVSSRAPSPVDRELRRTLGLALCRLHEGDRAGGAYRSGQVLLEQALELDPADRDSLTLLARTWRGVDDDIARSWILRALALDAADYGALGDLLDLELAREVSTDALPLLQPLCRPAMERCRLHARLGVNLPEALFHLGRLHLLADEPYEAFDAFALGLCTCSTAGPLEETLASLETMRRSGLGGEGVAWARELLVLGRAARLAPDLLGADPSRSTVSQPVVMLAGGTAPDLEAELRTYERLLTTGLCGFGGTVLAGGTRQGVSGLAAGARRSAGARFCLVGYLPRQLPAGAEVDDRYDELRLTGGASFSPSESLRAWNDLLAAGVDPADVRLLGINGGPVAAAEYRLAASLGAAVGLVEGSGREAARLLADPLWARHARVIPLPPDPDVVHAFLTRVEGRLDASTTESVAQAIHQTYLRETAYATTSDPSLRAWDDLPADLQESNRDQARHYAGLLAVAGYEVAAVRPGTVSVAELLPDEVERMAAAEHGRWASERLLAGWRWGSERDPSVRTSPYLVEWEHLPEEVRDMDRVFVRRMPELLAQVGLEVRRRPPAAEQAGTADKAKRAS